MPINETLTQDEIYSTSTSETVTSDVLSSEYTASTASGWAAQKQPVKIRVLGPAPNSAIIGAIERLYSLGDLQRGWNSYDAEPIQPTVIDHTARLLPMLLQSTTPEPAVVPRVRGGIQLEWHRKGIDLEVYIDSNMDIHFEAEDLTSAETAEAPLAGNEELLKQWITRISE